jgi:hypothetical protein
MKVMALQRTVVLGLVLVVICAIVAGILLSRPRLGPEERVAEALRLMCDAPNEGVVEMLQMPPQSDLVRVSDNLYTTSKDYWLSDLRTIYGEHFSEDYLEDFFLKNGMMFNQMANRMDFTLTAQDLVVTEGDGRYDYTLTLVCDNGEGKCGEFPIGGSARLDEKGLVENINPYRMNEVMDFVGMW